MKNHTTSCDSYYVDGIVYACTCGKCVDSNTLLTKKSVGKKAVLEAMKVIDEYTKFRKRRISKAMATSTAKELVDILLEFEAYRRDNQWVPDRIEALLEFLQENNV